MKTSEELESLLKHLVADWENEVVEFKIGNKNTPSDEIGRCFSALANEANLRGSERAWLVFGVNNKNHGAPGSEYPCDSHSLNKSGGLKAQITQGTNLGMCLTGVHVLPRGPETNVIFFESASREKINELLIDEIRGDYSREQKLTKIGNILSYMRRKGLIVNLSTDHSPIWVLFKTYEKLRDNKEKNHSAKTEEVCP